jgi:hypothetical protein
MIFGKHDFAALTFTINGSTFRYGDFINYLITFVSIAAVIFFFVVEPVNRLMERRTKEDPRDEGMPRVHERDPGQGAALPAVHLTAGRSLGRRPRLGRTAQAPARTARAPARTARTPARTARTPASRHRRRARPR